MRETMRPLFVGWGGGPFSLGTFWGREGIETFPPSRSLKFNKIEMYVPKIYMPGKIQKSLKKLRENGLEGAVDHREKISKLIAR